MIVVSDIITGLNDSLSTALDKAQNMLNISSADIIDRFIIKSSIDARHGKQPKFVSSIGFLTRNDEKTLVKKINLRNVSFRAMSNDLPEFKYGKNTLKNNPVIVGFGPAGMFAGLVLARHGYFPIIIERGESVDNRVKSVETFWETGKLNTQSNVQFGEGGAGTFSDGKLTTRINDPLCDFVLNELVRFGAPDAIKKKAKPHIGTDKLRNIVKEVKAEIIRLGGQVLTCSQLTDITVRNGKIEQITVNGSSLPCSALFLAIGHSARDTFAMLMKKAIMFEAKPFSMGVRIEHLQTDINAALYGKYTEHPMLPQGEYQLSLRKNDRAVYTFCMCPGGVIVPSSSETGTVVTNGMSEYARDKKNANSALVVSVSPKDFGDNPNNAIEFQRKYERIAFSAGGEDYSAPAQTVGCFMRQKIGLEIGRIVPSYALGVKPCDFNAILPPFVTSMMRDGLLCFGRKMRNFNANDAVLTGLETRTSSPVRILRDENYQSISVKGLFPCGEGAGYAGGIMSAAVDGIKTALSFMKQYKPL